MKYLILIALVLGSAGCGKEPALERLPDTFQIKKKSCSEQGGKYLQVNGPNECNYFGPFCITESAGAYFVNGKEVPADACQYKMVVEWFQGS